MFSHYLLRYKQYDVNKTEQETPFSEKTIKNRHHIVHTHTDTHIIIYIYTGCKRYRLPKKFR